MLIGHVIARDETLGPAEGAAFDYVLTAAGLFLRAERDRIRALFPIASVPVRGLAEIAPEFELGAPRVPAGTLAVLLAAARAVARAGPRECLFHLWVDDDGEWRCEAPPQVADATTVRPIDDGPGSSHDKALIELHSHHDYPAIFSTADDRDERGFRIYAVLGTIHCRPTLAVRLGVHGYFWSIPASWVFEDGDAPFDEGGDAR